jgi:hypothetical protein
LGRKIHEILYKILRNCWVLLSKTANFIDNNGDLRFILSKILRPQRTYSRWAVTGSMNGRDLNLKLLEECEKKTVLEFGSGGSTLFFASCAEKVVSIESDKKYSEIVNNEIIKRNLQAKAMVLYSNIGPTKSFGQPIEFLKPLYKFKYKNYIESYFRSDREVLEPQVVFIDGRFRVWCAIECCKRIKHNFTIILDDYFSRPEYHILEKLIGPALPFSGDTAMFRINTDQLDLEALCLDEKYEKDFR